MDAELIDKIYECAFVPELWPGVLDELAGLSGARGGLLFAVRGRVLNWTSSGVLSEVFQTYVDDGWFRKCSRQICLFGRNDPTFLVEHDFWTSEELDANPIYRDFFRPRGLGWSAGTGLPLPSGDNIVFSVEREMGQGPVDDDSIARLNALRPHLARSALVAARLGMQRAVGAAEALSLLGMPTVLLDSLGSVVEANEQAMTLTDHIRIRPGDRLALSDAQAGARLADCLEALKTPVGRAVQSFPVRDDDGHAALVGHVIPVSRSAHDIFARSFAILVLTPLTAERAPPADLIRSLFDLTVSEARVARGVAVGQTPEEIADAGGVALSTVRTQLRQVLEKTGCSRQAEVAVLMSTIALGRA